MDISSSSALITGGASGLGAATAEAALERGATVVIVDLNEAAGHSTAERLGSNALFVRADVSDASQVEEAVSAAMDAGPLRLVVNCAGIAIGERMLDREGNHASLERFQKVLNVNLVGTYTVSAIAAAAMAKTEPLEFGERGLIVNTASVAAYEGQIGQTAYSASKGGIVGLTVPMARDLSSVGIRVNTIAPGIIDTPLLAGLGDAVRDSLAATVPFPKRLGTPEDYATLVMALVDNGYMNGETIRMDGALRMAPK